MKKICFVMLMLFTSFTVFSQKSGTFNDIGAIVGPGMSHILGGDSWDPMFGLLLGVETNVYDISEASSIKAGIVFTLQGAKYSDSYSTDSYLQTLKSIQFDEMSSGKVSLSYIYIPVVYNYKTDMGLYLEGGIQPGFLVSAKDEYDGGDSEDYKDAIKTFDLGIPVGAGYWINDRVSIGARAVFGLTTIDTEESVDYEENNRNFMLMGILRFNFNKE